MTTYNANEIRVISGNAIVVGGVLFRLFGMRVPSLAFREGMDARAALAGKIEDHGTIEVKIIPDRRSSKTQDMCELFTPSGENINHWMVKSGFAKTYVGGGA